MSLQNFQNLLIMFRKSFLIIFYLLKAGRFRSNGSTEIENVRGRIFTDSVFPDFFARGRALCLRRSAKKFYSRKNKLKNSWVFIRRYNRIFISKLNSVKRYLKLVENVESYFRQILFVNDLIFLGGLHASKNILKVIFYYFS